VRPSACAGWRAGRHLMLMRPGARGAVLEQSGHGRLSGLIGLIVRQGGLGDGPTAPTGVSRFTSAN
jgi:hypothetical protein